MPPASAFAACCPRSSPSARTASFYIPHGEPGMRRMIAALLALRPPVENDPLEEQIRWFQADQPESASPMSVPESSARSSLR